MEEQEIKEILDCFKRHIEQNESMCCLSMNDVSNLLDYMTNLQEENEHLNAELNTYKDEFCKDTIKEYELVMEQEDYKSRCEKAIKYINNIPTIICRYYDYNKHMRCYPGTSYEKLKENVKKDGTLEGHFVEVNKDKILNILNGDDFKPIELKK